MSEQRLLRSIDRFADVLLRMERNNAASVGVSVSQMRILLRLIDARKAAQHEARLSSQEYNANHGGNGSNGLNGFSGLRISDLAQSQGLAVSTMTRNLSGLERKGWIRRQKCSSDGRAVNITLSDEGATVASQLSDERSRCMGTAFKSFHPSDRLERAVAMERIAAALEQGISE